MVDQPDDYMIPASHARTMYRAYEQQGRVQGFLGGLAVGVGLTLLFGWLA